MASQQARSASTHIVASVTEEASGPSYSVPRLCKALAKRGNCVRLFTVGKAGEVDSAGYQHTIYRQDWANVPLVGRLCASSALHRALKSQARKSDILHIHGLWLMPNIYPAWVARRTGTPLVISPRGMLGQSALQYSRMKKRLFWRALQGSAVASAACLHATSTQEYEDIRRFGLRGPVAVIPNGVDIPKHDLVPKQGNATKTVLFLGRIHPKKGIDQLIGAWARIQQKYPDWQLRIVGPLNSPYSKTLQKMIAKLGASRVQLCGPLYGVDKTQAYDNADLFVLPSLNENFANSVAEALALGTPVISTKGAPWEGLESHGCGWWVDHGVNSLAISLDRAMSLDWEQLRNMGKAGRAWMARDFDWDSIALGMSSVYSWLAGKDERPACVMTD